MKPKFKFGQFIVKKAWECGNNTTSYGVFKVYPYMKVDVEGNTITFDIEYKINLIPVGESRKKFSKTDYYTSDLWDVPKECIFNDQTKAETYMKENFKD